MTNFAEDGYRNSGAARSAGDPTSEPGAGVAVAPAAGPEQIRDLLAGKFVCPFCGSINESEQGVCPRCTMENSPASRKATKSRIGPWYVLQTRNPAAPGMKFETLLNFARKGRVKPKSIVRGPTSHQLWKFAAQVKGLSREFGVCYSCGGPIEATTSLCPQCNRLQDPPANPDVLLETKDAPAPPVAQRPSRLKEPDLAEVDAEFVIPALGGTASDDSVAGVSLSGSMAGVAFDPLPRNEAPVPSPIASSPNPAPAAFPSGFSGRNNKKDEGFLSPKDLAAAFKLNFSPGPEAEPAEPRPPFPERRRPPRGPADPRSGGNGDDRRQPRQRLQHPLDFQPHRAAPAVNPADVLAAPRYDAGIDDALALSRPARKPTAKTDAGPRRPRRFRFLKALVFLVVFGGALYATAIYLEPKIWQDSLHYYNQGKTALLKAINGSKPATQPAAPALPDSPDPTSTADATDPGASAAPTPGDAAHPGVSPPAAPDHASDAQPASATSGGTQIPAPAPAPLPSTLPAAAPVVAAPVATPSAAPQPVVPAPVSAPVTPSVVVTPTPAPPAPAPAAPTSALDPAGESLKLYREAMGLAATNPAKAAELYRKIKKFPKEDWPSDLDLRLKLAEGQTGQQH
jgi:hypothetical protein